jgi:phosphatidylinositol alpha-mannosyltransferase
VLDDGAAGRLVAVEDPAALADALIAVLADDALRAGYVEAARAVVRQYDWDVVADDIFMVYETVAGAGVKVTVAGVDRGLG